MVEKILTPVHFNEAGDILAAFWYQRGTRHFRSGGHLYAELYINIEAVRSVANIKCNGENASKMGQRRQIKS